MTHATLKIICLAEDRAARQRLIKMLTQSGYKVTAKRVEARQLQQLEAIEFQALPTVRQPTATISNRRPLAGGKRGRAASPPEVVILTARRPLSRPTATRGGEQLGGPESAEKPVIMNLRGLRKAVGRTQGDVARSAAMSQPQLSRVEARSDHLISTLRKYVRALGGDVEVVARLGKARILLRGV
jgi:hypothetical protein